MKVLEDFASKFGGKIVLNSEFILEKGGRYYLLNPTLRKVTHADFYYAGLYLGKVKKGIFFPSFNYLKMLCNVATNKVVLDGKAAWLFICGRDAFLNGILKMQGSRKRGDFTMVVNEFGECLGFGKVVDNFDMPRKEVVIENVLDVGDFLRRES